MALRMILMGANPWRMKLLWKLSRLKADALFFHHVGAELHDLELAERVVEIGGVGGAAFGFHETDGVGLVAVGDEEIDGLVEGELAGVELDGVDEAGVAEEGVLELAEANEFGFAARLRSVGASVPGWP